MVNRDPLLVGLLSLAACAADHATEAVDAPITNAPATPGASAAQEQLDETDDQAFGHWKNAVTIAASSNDDIWLEAANHATYEIDKMPFYFIRRNAQLVNQRGYLLQFPQAGPPHGSLVNAPAFGGLGNVYRYDDQNNIIQDGNFSFSEIVAGTDTFVFPYRPASNPPTEADSFDPSIPNSDEFFFLLVHEAFHRFQLTGDSTWADYPGWTQDEATYPLGRENLALAMLENKVLIAGLQSNDNALKAAALQQVIAIRKTRLAAPWAVIGGVNYIQKLELPQEWSEGTANYVELKFSDIAHKLPNGLVAEAVKNLDRSLHPGAGFSTHTDVSDEFAFGRFYATGSAIGLLLDAVGGVDWRSACKTAQTQYDSALKVYPNVDANAQLVAAKSTYGYDALLPVADEFLALPPGDPQGMKEAIARPAHHHRPRY